jgi:hypothetical protein
MNKLREERYAEFSTGLLILILYSDLPMLKSIPWMRSEKKEHKSLKSLWAPMFGYYVLLDIYFHILSSTTLISI